MTDQPTPADPTEPGDALSHALRHDRSGRRTRIYGDLVADAAAEHMSF